MRWSYETCDFLGVVLDETGLRNFNDLNESIHSFTEGELKHVSQQDAQAQGGSNHVPKRQQHGNGRTKTADMDLRAELVSHELGSSQVNQTQEDKR